ncbi:class I SAM-dependent methyltransferase [Patescibacteria group bacterium]|nr:class I SAM-dependent methyltransferase [Patescibacteria group bacterium]
MSFIQTFQFWNSRKNVQYFKDKPADPRIEKRLIEFRQNSATHVEALDLGCGGGRHTELLVTLGFSTHAIDLNPQMLRCTKDRVGGNNIITLKRASIIKLPFRNNFFDVVVTTGVLHQAKNITEYQLAICELSRVVKQGGLVCLNIFTSAKLDPTYRKNKDVFSFKTKEGLDMTLLNKELFYNMMSWYGLTLEQELSEDFVQENTGERSVLRCNFIKL